MRIDRYLVENKYFSSREKAVSAIKEGRIILNDKVIIKPSLNIKNDDNSIKINILPCEKEYVSRGGKKLEHAVFEFQLNLKDKVVLDIGSSTGGFTDCSLHFGARKVCAIDVGTKQMDEKLSLNEKVYLKENFNLKNLKFETFNEVFDYIVTDVSFISLKHVFPIVNAVSCDKTIFIALIKPQFETENSFLNKNGVIKNEDVHIDVINKIISYANENNFQLNDLTYSPIKGKKEGNIEFLAKFSHYHSSKKINISDIVSTAHKDLNK